MASFIPANQPTSGDRDGWFKSSYSTGACTCVEVKFDGDQASIRDSKRTGSGDEPGTDASVITVDRSEWAAFVDDVLAGATRRCQAITLAPAGDGSTALIGTRSGITLRFEADEWSAFSAGVAAGEFDL